MLETQELINQLGALSYLGIFGVSIISNVVVPFPEEIVILVFGYLVGAGRLNFFILLPIIISGLLISDTVMYFLSKKGNRLITLFYQKIFAARLESNKDWLLRHINKVIFFSRFLVQLRFLGPFLAGQNGIPYKKFLLLDLCALLIYVPMYLLIGLYFRSRIEFISSGINSLRNIIISIVVILLVVGISRFFRRLLLGKKIKKFDQK